jgi:acetyl esterase/lipase
MLRIEVCFFVLNLAAGWPLLANTCTAAQGNPTGNYIIPGVIGDIVYRSGVTLDAYSPPGTARLWAVLIHGRSGNKRTHLTQLFSLLTDADYAWFAVDYRNAEDVKQAIQFTECPGRFNIKGKPLLIGEDSGVAIALKLANNAVAGVVGFGTAGLENSLHFPESKVLLFHGTADEDAPMGPVKAWCLSGNSCRLVEIPGGIHQFENWHPDQWFWKDELVAWIRNGQRGLWKDIVYSRPGGRPLRMDAFLPEGDRPSPAVIIVHGGGWEAGDKVTYISPILEALAQAGFTWFSIEYRLIPYVHNEAQLDDLRDAIRYVRRHSDTFHIKPDAIAIVGESASGQMVSQVASVPCPGCQVQAVVSFYGVYNFISWVKDQDGRKTLDRLFGRWNDQVLREFSPISHISPRMPPILLIQGTADELYAGTLEYEKELQEAGAPHKMILLKGAPHGMENWAGHPEWDFYRKALTDWLIHTLGAP